MAPNENCSGNKALVNLVAVIYVNGIRIYFILQPVHDTTNVHAYFAGKVL